MLTVLRNISMTCMACLLAFGMLVSCDNDSDAEPQLSDYVYTGMPGREGGYCVIKITEAPEIASEKGWPKKGDPFFFEGVYFPDSVFIRDRPDMSFHFKILSVRDTLIVYPDSVFMTYDWIKPRYICKIKNVKDWRSLLK